ncbi:bacterial alpha-L-rhamnosidase-domain-containing protein [Ilyonectria destructans]|nr:bacterial alpha-L-rhamnosidase-domain-containing protein [Ilyonectria destructans]
MARSLFSTSSPRNLASFLGLRFPSTALFNIVKETHRAKAAKTLQRIISENDHLIGTGFAGTQVLMPSWLYQVVQNGTTTWERWDSLLPDGSLNTRSMPSFNHCSLGSVADWMHQVIGGLSPATPGWKTFNVSPIPGGNITSAEATFISGYGEIKSEWWIEDQKVAPNPCGFRLSVQVPPNSRAIITLPSSQELKNVGSGYYEFYVPEFKIRGTS